MCIRDRVKGEIGDGKDILCRVHSECLTGDTFGSLRCDCGQQLAAAMTQIEKEGRGIPVSYTHLAGYAEGKVLMSKRVNADYYSKMMAEKAGSTVSLDANYDAIQNLSLIHI